MSFLYMKHLEFPGQSDYGWKSCLCVTEVLKSFQMENHAYIVHCFQKQLQTGPQMGRSSWEQGWDPLGWVSIMEWCVDLGGKIQNCTCQEDEIHVEFKNRPPLCEIYLFIKKTIRKDKTKWSVMHRIQTNGFPCKCSWGILGDNENVTKLSSSVLNIYNVETDIELRELWRLVSLSARVSHKWGSYSQGFEPAAALGPEILSPQNGF